ncbi:MAG: monofunctional biosynthetic peptidoglycan transglycosylase [Candidatus Kapaibacteriota bacterium]
MIKKIAIILFKTFIYFLISSVLIVVIYKVINPPITPLMVIRAFEYIFEGREVKIDKSWASYEDINKKLFKALVSGEDARFMTHKGFDWKAIKAAQRYNDRMDGEKKRGASTITMQTAKNTFLWHGRNYVRKALEAYFTVLIEAIWGKKRIIEVYANVIEWGYGIYGAQAASRYYFGKDAKDLTTQEAALLAAVVPNPRRWNAGAPTPYIRKRANWIMSRMNSVAIPRD